MYRKGGGEKLLLALLTGGTGCGPDEAPGDGEYEEVDELGS